MNNLLAGKSLNLIRAQDGLIAGQPRWYELWVTGGTIEIRDEETVSTIERASKEAKRLAVDTLTYVRWVLTEGEDEW